jgi:hypothetical protein
MGSYDIVIGKKDGKTQIDGKGFGGLECLKFLEKLRLGNIMQEELKTDEPHLVNTVPLNHTVLIEDDL